MMHEIAKHAARSGHEVFVVCTRTPGSPSNSVVDGVPIKYEMMFENIASVLEPDMIITQFEDTLRVIQYAHKHKIPMGVIVHNDHRRTQAMVHALRKNDLLIFNTNWIEEKFTYNCKGIVVHPPTDKKYFRPTNKKREYITLVNVAPEKGSHIFYHLAEKFPQYKFLGVQGGYWKDRQVVEDLPNVTIIPQTDNMRDDVYAKSRIVLMPSSYESFGMVAAEAMACGIPVVVSDTEGLKENVGDGGFIIPLEKMSTWASVVDSLMQDGGLYEISSQYALEQSKVIDTEGELDLFIKTIEEM